MLLGIGICDCLGVSVTLGGVGLSSDIEAPIIELFATLPSWLRRACWRTPTISKFSLSRKILLRLRFVLMIFSCFLMGLTLL